MSTRTKSTLLLAGVLLLGMLLGALVSGTISNRRLASIAELRTSRGMAFVLEEVVQPANEEQRNAFRAVIEETAPEYADVFERTGAELRALNDSVLARVRPLLTQEQVERLQGYLTMRREGRFGPRNERGNPRKENPNRRRPRRVPEDSALVPDSVRPPSS
ncbi:MAG: hypothetical protein E4H28_06430 [Gemmatimonadales bacterium]|nr:MAG: hypothetical protein E4H28_06430 [Gemmatimonadales bacterium]